MQPTKRMVCVLLALLLLWVGIPAVSAAEYTVSSTALTVGENRVSADKAVTTLYVFKPTQMGAYVVAVEDAAANLSYWHGSKHYVTGLAQEAVDGVLTVTCSSVGQTFLIGLSNVDVAVITITAQEGYVPPEAIVYETYVNRHTPVADFALPDAALTAVDIQQPQTVVADAAGIYHLGNVDGPILYVNMCAATYADLYACYHPSGGAGALSLRGRYEDGDGNPCGYEFLDAMRPYAEALDSDGYYYLTVDLAAYIQIYGQNQGWFRKDVSPFSRIKQGKFIAESAWLVNVYYVEPPTLHVSLVGDVNGDGKVNNRDLGALQQHINDWGAAVDSIACDLNGDGVVNNRDLGLLQQTLNG